VSYYRGKSVILHHTFEKFVQNITTTKELEGPDTQSTEMTHSEDIREPMHLIPQLQAALTRT